MKARASSDAATTYTSAMFDATPNPPIQEPFHPPWSLRNPNVQAILGTKRPAKRIWRRRGLELDPISSDHVLDCGDGVRLTGRHTPATGPARGLVVLIHGWEGFHDSNYLYSIACVLHRAGYASFRLNRRDHANSYALNEGMFHSARMAEVLGGIRAIQALDAARPLSVIGFSLGGNFALRVGLQGPAAGVHPALCIGVSPVLVPGHTLIGIDQGTALFQRYFLKKWRETMDRKSAAWPGRYDFSRHKRMDNFTEITRAFVEDYTEFSTLDEYLGHYTLTVPMLTDSPTPLALMTAHDDTVIPIADFEGLSARGSVVAFDASPHGGHCGFIRNWRMESWAETRIQGLLESTR